MKRIRTAFDGGVFRTGGTMVSRHAGICGAWFVKTLTGPEDDFENNLRVGVRSGRCRICPRQGHGPGREEAAGRSRFVVL